MNDSKKVRLFDIASNSVPSARHTLVETVGNKRVLVENHHGMTEYSKQMICMKASFGLLCITGRGLRILQMTKEKLAIAGCIQDVQLLQGSRE